MTITSGTTDQRQVRSYRRSGAMVGAARTATREVLLAWDVEREHLDDVVLVVSELMGNAYKHTLGTAVILTLTLHDGAVLIEVFDGSALLPTPLGLSDVAESGRGLLMVAAVSASSGGHLHGSGKVMWAEVLVTPQACVLLTTPARLEAELVPTLAG